MKMMNKKSAPGGAPDVTITVYASGGKITRRNR